MRRPESCPTCAAIAWYRDGVTIVDRGQGELRVTRVMPSVLPDEPWSCADCGHEVADWLPLAHRLRELSEEAVEASSRGGFVA
jgi:hypothetical protein